MAFVCPTSARLLVFQRIASCHLCFVSTQTIVFFPLRRKLGFRFCGVRCGAGGVAMAAELRPVVKDQIDLTENEGTIFRRLLDVVGHFKLNTQLRVAGGWVRDKVGFYFHSALWHSFIASRSLRTVFQSNWWVRLLEIYFNFKLVNEKFIHWRWRNQNFEIGGI